MLHPEDGIISLERMLRDVRELEMERDAADLDLFLGDSWPVHRILRDGGVIISFDKAEPDGSVRPTLYAVDKKLFTIDHKFDLPRQFQLGDRFDF